MAEKHKYGSPEDVAQRILEWLGKNARQDATSLLLYEAMQALKKCAASPDSDSAQQAVCDLGMGCEGAGVCYASAHGEPERCGKYRASSALPAALSDYRVKSLARAIISAYKGEFALTAKCESHLHDCITAKLDGLASAAAPAPSASQPLGEPFQSVLHDNLSSLYVEDKPSASVQYAKREDAPYAPLPVPSASPDTFPARLLHESAASLAERVDSWHQRNPAGKPVASPAALTDIQRYKQGFPDMDEAEDGSWVLLSDVEDALAAAQPPAAAEAEPTEAMIDAARPLFLALECGATSIEAVREHVSRGGRTSIDHLPAWFREEKGHLTKAGRAIIAWHMMRRAAMSAGIAPKENGNA